MTLDPKAWPKLLQCPQTGGSLVWLGTKRLGALNAAIVRGQVHSNNGAKVESLVSAALHQRASGWIYPRYEHVLLLGADDALRDDELF